MIASIIVGILICIFIGWIGFEVIGTLKFAATSSMMINLVYIVMFVLMCATVYCVYQRIKEIRRGDYDDINKY